MYVDADTQVYEISIQVNDVTVVHMPDISVQCVDLEGARLDEKVSVASRRVRVRPESLPRGYHEMVSARLGNDAHGFLFTIAISSTRSNADALGKP